MRPAILRTSEEAFTASGKSPRIWVRAMRNRLPKLWPLSPRPDWKRYWKRRESSAESSLRATMQLRMSPGGRTSNSRRRRPELPPSSVTVTMAVISTEGLVGPRGGACCFSPGRTRDRPGPPPMETTRSGESSSMGDGRAAERPPLPHLLFRIKQGMERSLFGQRSEIRILARKQTVARFQFNGAAEVLLGTGKVAGECLGERQRIVDMVGAGSHGQRLLQVGAGFGEIARVDQRHAVVIAFLGGAETHRGLLETAVAHGNVQFGALGDVALGACGCLLEENARFGELARVESLYGGFERAQLCEGGSGGPGFRLRRGSGIPGVSGCLWFRHAPVSLPGIRRALVLVRHGRAARLYQTALERCNRGGYSSRGRARCAATHSSPPRRKKTPQGRARLDRRSWIATKENVDAGLCRVWQTCG